ncbi:hypothetical protein [Chryseobacterium sp. M5A1_1a]
MKTIIILKFFYFFIFLNILILKGQVGINTATPQAALDISTQGNSSATKAMKINNSSNTEIITITDAGRVGIGAPVPTSELQVVGNELRVGGPASQSGTIANPILRIHSNANADGSGGTLWFNENNTDYGYYLKQNTGGGSIYGFDGLAIGSAQPTRYDYNPARPGIFISDRQNIGLGTATPQTMLHIDGARDNNINLAPTITQQDNDVVVSTSGNMGIGTIVPTNKLDIRSTTSGAIKIADGTEADGKVLTSDINGVGTWKTVAVPFGVLALPAIVYTHPAALTVAKYTGVPIILPPGKWLLNITLGIEFITSATDTYVKGSNFIRFRVGDTTADMGISSFSSDAIKPRLAAVGFGKSEQRGMITDNLAINNSSGANKTYYLFVDNESSLGGRVTFDVRFDWEESAITYQQIQ